MMWFVLGCARQQQPTPPTLADPPSQGQQLRELVEPAAAGASAEDSDKAQLKRAILSHSGEVKTCYSRRLAEVPTLEGRVELGWTLNAGAVEGIYVIGNDTGDAELARCLVDALKQWTFDPSLAGDVTWPFVFQLAP